MKFRMNSSDRTDRRHILLNTGSKEKVEKIILEYLGILGFSRCSPIFTESGKGIILSVNRGELENVRAAFEMCKDEIKIVKVSGTLRGL